MYSNIYNFKTKSWIKTNTYLGKRLLKHYLFNIIKAGSVFQTATEEGGELSIMETQKQNKELKDQVEILNKKVIELEDNVCKHSNSSDNNEIKAEFSLKKTRYNTSSDKLNKIEENDSKKLFEKLNEDFNMDSLKKKYAHALPCTNSNERVKLAEEAAKNESSIILNASQLEQKRKIVENNWNKRFEFLSGITTYWFYLTIAATAIFMMTSPFGFLGHGINILGWIPGVGGLHSSTLFFSLDSILGSGASAFANPAVMMAQNISYWISIGLIPLINLLSKHISKILAKNAILDRTWTKNKYDWNDRNFVKAAIIAHGDTLKQLNPEFKDDLELCFLAISQDIEATKYCSDRIKDDEEFVKYVLSVDGNCIRHVNKRFRKDPDMAKLAIQSRSESILLFDKNIINDREMIILAIQSNPHVIENIDKKYRNEKEIMEQCILLDGILLSIASNDIKDDIEIVKKAINQNRNAFRYASDRIKNDIDLCESIYKMNPSIIRFMSVENKNELRKRRRINEKLLLKSTQKGGTLPLEPEEEEEEEIMTEKEIENIKNMIKEARHKKIKTENMLIQILRSSGLITKNINYKDVNNNKKLFKLIIDIDGMMIRKIRSFHDNEEMMSIAVKSNGLALQYGSHKIKNNEKVVMLAMKENGLALKHSSRNIRKTNKEIALAAVQNCGISLFTTMSDIRNDPDIIIAALKNNPTVFLQLTNKEKHNPTFIMTAIEEHGYFIEKIDAISLLKCIDPGKKAKKNAKKWLEIQKNKKIKKEKGFDPLEYLNYFEQMATENYNILSNEEIEMNKKEEHIKSIINQAKLKFITIDVKPILKLKNLKEFNMLAGELAEIQIRTKFGIDEDEAKIVHAEAKTEFFKTLNFGSKIAVTAMGSSPTGIIECRQKLKELYMKVVTNPLSRSGEGINLKYLVLPSFFTYRDWYEIVDKAIDDEGLAFSYGYTTESVLNPSKNLLTAFLRNDDSSKKLTKEQQKLQKILSNLSTSEHEDVIRARIFDNKELNYKSVSQNPFAIRYVNPKYLKENELLEIFINSINHFINSIDTESREKFKIYTKLHNAKSIIYEYIDFENMDVKILLNKVNKLITRIDDLLLNFNQTPMKKNEKNELVEIVNQENEEDNKSYTEEIYSDVHNQDTNDLDIKLSPELKEIKEIEFDANQANKIDQVLDQKGFYVHDKTDEHMKEEDEMEQKKLNQWANSYVSNEIQNIMAKTN